MTAVYESWFTGWYDRHDVWREAAQRLLVEHGVRAEFHRPGAWVEGEPGVEGRASASRRLIRVPQPVTVVDFAIVAHEAGHVVLGHRGDGGPAATLRCEVEATDWALAVFDRWELPDRDVAEFRLVQSIRAYVGLARETLSDAEVRAVVPERLWRDARLGEAAA